MIPGLELWAEQHLDVLGVDDRDMSELYAVCPFCGKGKKHFAISLTKGKYHCFRCGKGGTVPFLMAKLDPEFSIPRGMESDEAMYLANSYLSSYMDDVSLDEFSDYYDEVGRQPVNREYKKVQLNGVVSFDSDDPLAKEGRMYWYSRGLSRELALDRNICIGVDGKLEGRIVIPVYVEGEMKSYTARTFIGSDLRYFTGKKKDGWAPINQYVYGLDRVEQQDHVVLVEGVFDAFSLWEHFPVCALFGKSATKSQAVRILSKYPSSVTVLLDPKSDKESQEQAPNPYNVANYFVNLVPEVRIAYLEEGDPGNNRKGAIEAVTEAKDFFEIGA